ncbi:MAG: phosphate ABC transporter permease subunit PstC [Polyangiaceae bacterium]|jgi:phosphate transport system permease protein
MPPSPHQSKTVARPPTPRELATNRAFTWITRLFAAFTVLLVLLIVLLVTKQAMPAILKYGLHFVASSRWDAGSGQFGILPEIYGTVLSSLIGVGLAALFGVAVAVFLTEEFIPRWLEGVLSTVVTLLAAIPSVVYGLWGIFVVIPAIRPTCNWLHDHLGWIPLFRTPLLSVGLMPAAVVLAIMILPTITAISRDAIAAVNPLLREAAFGMGATRWETIMGVTLPTSKRGIYGSVVLGLGRALGETMALAMLVGSANVISPSLFSPADTLAALLANKFPEAASPLDLGALMYAALVLLVLTLIVNMGGEWVVRPEFRQDASGQGKADPT